MHCKTGVRSAETLAIVKGAGYSDAVHVGGGVVGLGQPDRPQPAVVLTTTGSVERSVSTRRDEARAVGLEPRA